MSNSLKDQLLGLGFSAPKPEPRRAPASRPAQGPGGKPGPRQAQGKPPHAGKASPHVGKPAQRKQKSREDIDLAKAYAIRAQKEKDERIEAERQKQETARIRREARAKLATFLEGRSLNAADADIARHFEYGGKIKRIYVTADQLKALNAGELGVLQQNGRYLLVDAATLAEAEGIFADAVALKVDPDAPTVDDPYADPQYQVPDDLVW